MSDFQTNRASSDRDYSLVDSRAKAQRLALEGELVALLMIPEEFGGSARPENIVFVPAFAAGLKADFDANVIIPRVRSGRAVEYSVNPEYDGECLVPIALDIMALDPEPVVFRLAIWGKGLAARR